MEKKNKEKRNEKLKEEVEDESVRGRYRCKCVPRPAPPHGPPEHTASGGGGGVRELITPSSAFSSAFGKDLITFSASFVHSDKRRTPRDGQAPHR